MARRRTIRPERRRFTRKVSDRRADLTGIHDPARCGSPTATGRVLLDCARSLRTPGRARARDAPSLRVLTRCRRSPLPRLRFSIADPCFPHLPRACWWLRMKDAICSGFSSIRARWQSPWPSNGCFKTASAAFALWRSDRKAPSTSRRRMRSGASCPTSISGAGFPARYRARPYVTI